MTEDIKKRLRSIVDLLHSAYYDRVTQNSELARQLFWTMFEQGEIDFGRYVIVEEEGIPQRKWIRETNETVEIIMPMKLHLEIKEKRNRYFTQMFVEFHWSYNGGHKSARNYQLEYMVSERCALEPDEMAVLQFHCNTPSDTQTIEREFPMTLFFDNYLKAKNKHKELIDDMGYNGKDKYLSSIGIYEKNFDSYPWTCTLHIAKKF